MKKSKSSSLLLVGVVVLVVGYFAYKTLNEGFTDSSGCPTGQHYTACASGYRKVGSNCVKCPSGYSLNTAGTECHKTHSIIPTCPTGFTLNTAATECIEKSSPTSTGLNATCKA